MIFDDTDALVYDSGVRSIGNSSGQVKVSGNAAMFTPTATEWTANVTNHVSSAPRTFRWIVYGEFAGDNFTSAILTGAYWSASGEIIVTP